MPADALVIFQSSGLDYRKNPRSPAIAITVAANGTENWSAIGGS
jgi:hypothetical protein